MTISTAAPQKGRKFKSIRIRNRLGEKLGVAGGISREEAVKASICNVERLRNGYVEAIPGELGRLEEIAGPPGKVLTESDLNALLARAGRLLTLAGTFGYEALDNAVKSLCSLCASMIENRNTDSAPVHVHIRAMHLLAPGGAAYAKPDMVAILLAQLARIHAFLGVVPSLKKASTPVCSN